MLLVRQYLQDPTTKEQECLGLQMSIILRAIPNSRGIYTKASNSETNESQTV